MCYATRQRKETPTRLMGVGAIGREGGGRGGIGRGGGGGGQTHVVAPEKDKPCDLVERPAPMCYATRQRKETPTRLMGVEAIGREGGERGGGGRGGEGGFITTFLFPDTASQHVLWKKHLFKRRNTKAQANMTPIDTRGWEGWGWRGRRWRGLGGVKRAKAIRMEKRYRTAELCRTCHSGTVVATHGLKKKTQKKWGSVVRPQTSPLQAGQLHYPLARPASPPRPPLPTSSRGTTIYASGSRFLRAGGDNNVNAPVRFPRH